ncbi:ABC transporter ATP-binding protein [Bradyrhizobium sp. SRS-191]|uniref:ABC transporter ATP-binding protein n=1 Tax=Bradyrhizobium sp. SRS-191 TaxID=2962606 RepID=UPI00211DB46A|nr:ABC transporter ATP-binding protein [Bradyrhizobium sp. SRS-191]
MTSAHFNFNEDKPFVEVLHANDLTKRYGDEVAIANVSFSVAAGEIIGIVGPNGAGKTTLLEVLAGQIALDSGNVVWRGQALPAPRRKEAIFYMPDGIRPYQDRFAGDVLRFVSGVYERSRTVVSNVITAVELAPVLRKRVSALSKGYNRRLLLAIGLLTPQDVLLMDEPFDGFDIRQSRNIIQVLRNSAAGGRTLVLAIHQLADAERVCDRFLLLAGGKVRGIGTLQELRTQTALPEGSLEDIFLALT